METILKSNLSEIKISYINPIPVHQRITISKGADAEKYFRSIWDKETIDLQEQCKVLYLNRRNDILGHYNLATGSITGCYADVKLIFAVAVKVIASQILVAHNHPSGNLKPSKADKDLTQRIKQIATLFEMTLTDHLILSSENYYSMADNGDL